MKFFSDHLSWIAVSAYLSIVGLETVANEENNELMCSFTLT